MESFILIGNQGQGKTTTVLTIANILKSEDIEVSGIAAPVVFASERRIGYDILDLSSGIRVPWLRLRNGEAISDIGPFSIQSEGFKVAHAALTHVLSVSGGTIFIDEIGPLELQNGGHAWFMERIRECTAERVILTARPSVATEINTRWRTGSKIISVDRFDSIQDLLGIHGD